MPATKVHLLVDLSLVLHYASKLSLLCVLLRNLVDLSVPEIEHICATGLGDAQLLLG